MRKTKLFLLMAAMLLGTLSTSAYDFMVDGIAYNKLSNNTDVSVSYLSVRWETQTPSDPYGDFEYIYYYNEKNKYSGYIEIPSVVNYGSVTYNVTSIAQHAFQNCSNLTSITIPESVTSIGTYAFYGCSNLTSITCKAVTPPTIGNSNTFYNVDKSIPVYVPASSVESYKSAEYWSAFTNIQPIGTCGDNLTWRLTEEGELIIEGTGNMSGYYSGQAPWYTYRSSVKTITIEEGVTSIGNNAFCYCQNLTSVTIPEGVTSIGNYAFEDCKSLTAITIPTSVTKIGNYAFSGCGSFASVSIPSSVTYIGQGAFLSCQFGKLTLEDGDVAVNVERYAFGGSPFANAKIDTLYIGRDLSYDADEYNEWSPFYGSEVLKHVTVGGGAKKLGYYLFDCCTALNTVVVNEGVVEIGYQAFDYCPSLKTVRLPESLTQIGDFAFFTCENLSELTIPEKVTSIGERAFQNCSRLTSITCHAVTPPMIEGSHTFYSVDKTIPVYVPAESVKAYKAAAYWSAFTNILPLPITITINQYGSGTYSSPYALDFSNVKVLRAYVATGYNHITGEVTLLRVHTAEAGTGLLVKGTPGVTYEVPVIESTADHTLNLLVATLEKTRVDKYSSDGMYANYKYTVIKSESPEPLFYPFADGSSLSAGKAYLQLPKAWLPEKENFVIRYRFDEGETTGFDDEQVTIDNQSSLAEGESNMQLMIYDLMGRRVLSPKKGGIYIINGRKVVY